MPATSMVLRPTTMGLVNTSMPSACAEDSAMQDENANGVCDEANFGPNHFIRCNYDETATQDGRL